MSIRVILFIPGFVLRAGLQSVLSTDSEIEIVEAAASPAAARKQAQADVIVTGDQEDDYAELRAHVAAWDPAPALLLLTDSPGSLRRLSGFPARAWGLLPVDVEPGELFIAIRALHSGMVVSQVEAFKDALIAPIVENDWTGRELAEELTEREQQVLELLARGLANKQIALALSISEHTVKFHISSIYGKFNASNRTEAVRIGLRYGLIGL